MRTARALPFWTPLFAGGLVCLPLAVPAEEHLLRPPAVPLIACDPYFSIWSCADRLTDAPTTHWTGHPHRLTSLVRVDGKTFRVMGNEPAELPALPQTAVEVLPTRTIYAFEGGGIHLRLTFTTPALPDDLELLARPATYIDWEARAADGGTHEVSVYFDNTSEPAVDDSAQEVVGSRGGDDAARVLRFGTKTQAVLQKKGDSRRIDWGHILTILPADQRAAAAFVDPSGPRSLRAHRQDLAGSGSIGSAPSSRKSGRGCCVRSGKSQRRTGLLLDRARLRRRLRHSVLPREPAALRLPRRGV
jgi:hypothetical protein